MDTDDFVNMISSVASEAVTNHTVNVGVPMSPRFQAHHEFHDPSSRQRPQHDFSTVTDLSGNTDHAEPSPRQLPQHNSAVCREEIKQGDHVHTYGLGDSSATTKRETDELYKVMDNRFGSPQARPDHSAVDSSGRPAISTFEIFLSAFEGGAADGLPTQLDRGLPKG